MKNTLKRLTAVAVLVAMTAFTACGTADSTEDASGEETTASASAAAEDASESDSDWDELDQDEITAAMGMGWNLGNQLEASSNKVPNETVWGNPTIREDLIKSVKEQGFNTIRIPVSYLSKIGDAPDYTIDSAWLDRIQEVVDYVVDNDMFAIVNMHGDGYYTVDGGWLLCVDENQDEIKAKYEAVWTQIADRFKDYDEHLIFESMNEEFDNTYGNPDPVGYENINAYNQIFVDAVRKTGSNNTRRWLLMPGWNTNIDYIAGDYGFEIPDDSLCEADGKRIMISVHYYDPYNFTLDENDSSAKTQWGKYATEDYDSWGQEDYVDSQMKKMYDKFVSQGYPVVIGELGVQDKTHLSEVQYEYRCYWIEYVVKAAKDNGCVPVYWDNGYNGKNGYALFERVTGKVLYPEIIEGMMRAINSEGDYDIPAPDVEAVETSAEE
ncbi:MAG: glycoside hydrolase family 5 protein [Oscillospiraceae bacterium]|nr:glycoside hydrolase family 5 protein [Oscillospiraceae bacterium]